MKRKMKRAPDHPDNAKGLPHKYVTLTNAQYAKVDAEHFDAVNQFNWYAQWGKGTQSFYAKRNVSRDDGSQTTQPMHVYVGELIGLDLANGRTVDHDNHDTLDNTSGNLRSATQVEQCRNRRKQSNNKSGLIGVSWDKRRHKWNAYAHISRKQKHLGYFDDDISAAWVRENFVKEHHGDFATLNNPPERRAKPR